MTDWLLTNHLLGNLTLYGHIRTAEQWTIRPRSQPDFMEASKKVLRGNSVIIF